MNTTWTARSIVLMLVTAAACSEPQPQPQPTTQTTPAAAIAPGVESTPKAEAAVRVDVLLEDFKRREAAQAKFDRENPAPAANSIPASRSIPQAPIVAASSPAATDAPAARAPGASDTSPARDETWWKGQMQSLQLTLDEALAQLAEAEKRNFKYSYNDLQAEYKKRVAAVAEARLAIDRLHDEARRAGVPPGWLR